MSGVKKTVTEILQDDMRATKREIQDIKKQREQLQQEITRARQESATQVTQLKNQFEDRAKKHESTVKSLKSEMRDMATQHYEQMNRQRQEIMTEMQALEARTDEKVESLRDWTKDRLTEQRREYTRIAQQQQQQINILKRDIENINRREENRAQRAQEYLNDLETLIRNADENLPHARYAPGRLDRIKRQLDAARKQLKEDVPAATIATVQAAHFDLMDLEEEVMRLEMEFEMIYRTVTDAVSGLLGAVRKNRNIQLEESDVIQEANYWTNGQYQNLEDRVQELRNRLTSDKEKFNTAELNEYLNDLETLNQEQEKLLEEAIERIISSQMRAEMGDMVVEVLSRDGYRIKNQENGYVEHDQRAPYIVKLHNTNGTEIVAMISPEDNSRKNIVSINTFHDELNDDAGRRKRSNDIMQALKENGLQLGETECIEETISDFYDVENLLKQSGKKIPKQVLRKAGLLNSQTENISD